MNIYYKSTSWAESTLAALSTSLRYVYNPLGYYTLMMLIASYENHVCGFLVLFYAII